MRARLRLKAKGGGARLVVGTHTWTPGQAIEMKFAEARLIASRHPRKFHPIEMIGSPVDDDESDDLLDGAEEGDDEPKAAKSSAKKPTAAKSTAKSTAKGKAETKAAAKPAEPPAGGADSDMDDLIDG